MRYCACLHIFLALFYFLPLYGGFIHELMKQETGEVKSGKDLKSPRGYNLRPFVGSGG